MSNTIIWPGRSPFGMSVEARQEIEKKIGQGKCETVPRHVCHDFVDLCRSEIGSGADATVYKYYNPRTGRYVAGKVYKSLSKSEFERVKKSYEVLKDKPHCSQLLHFCDEKKMVFEELHNGPTLSQALSLLKTTAQKVEAISQIALGIKGIHSIRLPDSGYPLSHRDLKPSNIMFSFLEGGDFRLEIGDFVDLLDIDVVHGTEGYYSPAYYLFKPDSKNKNGKIQYHVIQGQKDDLFSFGLICLHILNGAKTTSVASFVKKSDKDITQDKLDVELEKALKNPDPLVGKVWKIVKDHLLRVEIKDTIDTFMEKFSPLKEEAIKAVSLPLIESLDLNEIPFKWDTFPLPPEAQEICENKIRKVISSRKQDTDKALSTGHITVPQEGYTWQYEFLYNGKEAFINTGEVLTQRDYKCYSPITGEFYALKDCGEDYKIIDWTYTTFEKKTHCVQRVYSDGKKYILEPYPHQTLSDVLRAERLTTTRAKLDAMCQIAEGMDTIHSIEYTNNYYESRYKGNFSHRTLNPDKIVVSSTYDIQCGEMTLLHERGNDSYQSPEEVKASSKNEEEYIPLAFNQGQRMDIWRLGQIFGRILQNSDQPICKMIDPKLPEKEQKVLKDAWKLVDKMLGQEVTIKEVLRVVMWLPLDLGGVGDGVDVAGEDKEVV